MTLRVFQHAHTSPLLSIPDARILELGLPTVSGAIKHLVKLVIVREITRRDQGRIYVYSDDPAILEEGTEPL